MPKIPAAENTAANVRAELGRQQRSGASLAESLGWTQAKVQRRLSGKVPFDVAELEKVAAELNVSLLRLIDSEKASA